MKSHCEIDEKALLTQFQSGDRLAFDKIFRIFQSALLFFANRLLINFDQIDPQDIVLDIFLKLHARRESFASLSSVKAFLYISTKNACFNAIQKEKIRLRRFDGYTSNFQESDADNILSQIVLSEVHRELYQAIELLPEQCRIIMLQLMDGQTAKEIAENLSLSISTVNSQKARAVSLLKKRMSRAGLGLLLFYI